MKNMNEYAYNYPRCSLYFRFCKLKHQEKEEEARKECADIEKHVVSGAGLYAWYKKLKMKFLRRESD
jgi:hypothetical protein